jgi:hypothetical protein
VLQVIRQSVRARALAVAEKEGMPGHIFAPERHAAVHLSRGDYKVMRRPKRLWGVLKGS